MRLDLLAGLLCLIIMAIFTLSAANLTFGSLTAPDAGLWPLSLSLCGIMLSILLLVFGKDSPESGHHISFDQLGLYIAAIMIFPALYLYTGFIAASGLTLGILIWKAGSQPPIRSATIAVLGTLSIYAVFAYALELQIDAF